MIRISNISFFRFCWKNGKLDWPKCAPTFQEDEDCLTICPLHRDEFGLGWRPSKARKYPLHDSKQKRTSGINKRLSEEIYQKWNVLCQIGQG